MPAQIITGWALIHDNLRRWSRTVKSPGAADDESIADACNTALQAIDDLVIEQGQRWAIRTKVVTDVLLDLGTVTEYGARRLFIEQDLGITDLAKVWKLRRVDSSGTLLSRRIYHDDDVPDSALNYESWREDGDFNAQSNYDMSIILSNWGTSLAGGALSITYWFTPALVTIDDFYWTDTDGNRTKQPPLPKKLWWYVQEYAKLVLLETTGDQYKQNALWQRWKGPEGIAQRARVLMGAFQLGEASSVRDSFSEEGETPSGW